MKSVTPAPQSSRWLWMAAVIVIGALGVRLFWVDHIPSGVNRDEAGLGYNAFLLLKTGQDEWGQRWPIALQSFGDYKLIGYILPTILTTGLLDMNELALRLPSVLAGVAVVVLSMWWWRQLGMTNRWVLIGGALVATTPLFIFYSRMAFEANLALAWFLVAWLLAAAKPRILVWQWWVDVGVVLGFLLACLTYNTPLLLTPLLIGWLVVVRGWRQWRSWLMPVLGVGLVALSLGSFLQSLTVQKSGITIFNDETIVTAYPAYREQFSGVWQTLFGNQLVYWADLAWQRLVASWGPHFLVIQGGSHPWHQLPGWSHLTLGLYIVVAIGYLVGLVYLLKDSRTTDWRHLLFSSGQPKATDQHATAWISQWYLWLCVPLALAPAIITADAPHATRSLWFITLLIITGWYGWWVGFRRAGYWKGAIGVITFGLLIWHAESVSRYIWDYFTLYPEQSRVIFQSDYQQALQEVEQRFPTGQVAVVNPDGFLYITTAWYLYMEPAEYFATQVRQLPDQIGFRYGERIGRFHFIAEAADRRADEVALLYWDEASHSWQIQE